jgi:hypothetical protein
VTVVEGWDGVPGKVLEDTDSTKSMPFCPSLLPSSSYLELRHDGWYSDSHLSI